MRIEHPGFATQMLQEPLGFQGQLAAERLRPQRAVEQQDAGRSQIPRGEQAGVGWGSEASLRFGSWVLAIVLFIRLF